MMLLVSFYGVERKYLREKQNVVTNKVRHIVKRNINNVPTNDLISYMSLRPFDAKTRVVSFFSGLSFHFSILCINKYPL